MQTTATTPEAEAAYLAMVEDLAAGAEVPLGRMLSILVAAGRTTEDLSRDVDAAADAGG